MDVSRIRQLGPLKGLQFAYPPIPRSAGLPLSLILATAVLEVRGLSSGFGALPSRRKSGKARSLLAICAPFVTQSRRRNLFGAAAASCNRAMSAASPSILFSTGNHGKFEEAAHALRALLPGCTVHRCDVDPVEVQGRCDDIASEKCRTALRLAQAQCLPLLSECDYFIAEDVSFHLGCLNGFPGPYVKGAWNAGCMTLFPPLRALTFPRPLFAVQTSSKLSARTVSGMWSVDSKTTAQALCAHWARSNCAARSHRACCSSRAVCLAQWFLRVEMSATASVLGTAALSPRDTHAHLARCRSKSSRP
jgi:Ham1 family